MERGSFFKFAQICSLSVEVNPNLMDKWAQMGAGINGEGTILLRVVLLADSRAKNGFLPRKSIGPFALLVGNR